jgi:hypothetical protein
VKADPNVHSEEVQIKAKSRKHEDSRQFRRAWERFQAFQASPRVGRRTGTTPHFAMWQADLEIKSVLQRTKLADLADSDSTPSPAAHGYAILASEPSKRFRNVWDLITADRANLLAVKGIGEARLLAIQLDLIEHKAQPRWAVGV